MKNKPLVSIDCITYNHAPYIRQCIEGFLMQKTDFDFEVLIHDDASTDGTQEIIKEYELKYPHIIKPIYQTENQWSKGISISATYNFPRAQGKYIAFCEGDDYWIDSYKLQKQIDLLDSNKEFGLCYTKANIYNQNQQKIEQNQLGWEVKDFKDLLLDNKIATLTTIIKKDLLLQYISEIKPNEKKWLMADYPMWLWYYANSKIIFFNEITSVYRVLENSASHSKDLKKNENFSKSTRDIRLYFSNLYLKDKDFNEVIYNTYYRENVYFGEQARKRKHCLKYLKQISNKTKREKFKNIAYKNKLVFSLLRYFNF